MGLCTQLSGQNELKQLLRDLIPFIACCCTNQKDQCFPYQYREMEIGFSNKIRLK